MSSADRKPLRALFNLNDYTPSGEMPDMVGHPFRHPGHPALPAGTYTITKCIAHGWSVTELHLDGVPFPVGVAIKDGRIHTLVIDGHDDYVVPE